MHIDLFSGIGGFTLACQWAGIETEVLCENDKRCQEFLQRTHPGVPIISDIREFDGTKWRGRFILTAGVPCQPASRAGKQRGKDDDRWLWPEALRVIGEAKPTWCLLENPPGIGDVGLAGILTSLENQAYEVRVFGIPACAVNSPQLRNRYWIVAHLQSTGRVREKQLEDDCECERGRESTDDAQQEVEIRSCDVDDWSNSVWLPCADGKIRRAPDDSFGVVDGLHRSVLAGLGNSIVPQVAYEIIRAIVEVGG